MSNPHYPNTENDPLAANSLHNLLEPRVLYVEVDAQDNLLASRWETAGFVEKVLRTAPPDEKHPSPENKPGVPESILTPRVLYVRIDLVTERLLSARWETTLFAEKLLSRSLVAAAAVKGD